MSTVLSERLDAALAVALPRRLGRLAELKGLHLLVRGIEAAVGELVEVLGPDGPVLAEAVASSEAGVVCMPLGSTAGLRRGDAVTTTGAPLSPFAA